MITEFQATSQRPRNLHHQELRFFASLAKKKIQKSKNCLSMHAREFVQAVASFLIAESPNNCDVIARSGQHSVFSFLQQVFPQVSMPSADEADPSSSDVLCRFAKKRVADDG